MTHCVLYCVKWHVVYCIAHRFRRVHAGAGPERDAPAGPGERAGLQLLAGRRRGRVHGPGDAVRLRQRVQRPLGGGLKSPPRPIKGQWSAKSQLGRSRAGPIRERRPATASAKSARHSHGQKRGGDCSALSTEFTSRSLEENMNTVECSVVYDLERAGCVFVFVGDGAEAPHSWSGAPPDGVEHAAGGEGECGDGAERAGRRHLQPEAVAHETVPLATRLRVLHVCQGLELGRLVAYSSPRCCGRRRCRRRSGRGRRQGHSAPRRPGRRAARRRCTARAASRPAGPAARSS